MEPDGHPRSASRGGTAADFLENVPLFADLPSDLRDQVAAQCHPVEVAAGSFLFHQDDDGDSLFVVRSGRLELLEENPPPLKVTGLIGPGACVGELALLMGVPRGMSVRAIRDSELIRLGRDEVFALLSRSQDFASGLLRVLGKQVRDATPAVAQRAAQATVITLLPLDRHLPLDRLRSALSASLGEGGNVTSLDASEVESAETNEEELAAEYGRLLDRHERDDDLVFLIVAQGAPPGWERFCIRQADRLVAIATVGDSLSDAARRPELHGCHLLFWTNPERGRIAAWLDGLQVRTHHLVDPSDLAASLARAVRRLTGQATGVVLSGGGARGLAHVGVLAGLLELGVTIDRIGGSSFGALVAGMFALGMEPDEIAERCRQELVDRKPFNDRTIPRVSLIRGRRFRSMLGRVMGDALIEELGRDYFCVSADMETAELVVHRRGSVASAVATSMALPGMLPPVLTGRHALLDGSVLSALPVHVMARSHEGPVIAVDVTGRRWTGRSLRTQSLPSIVETISRAASLGGSLDVESERGRARLVIEPETPDVGQFDFDRIHELIESGRRAALAAAEGGWP